MTRRSNRMDASDGRDFDFFRDWRGGITFAHACGSSSPARCGNGKDVGVGGSSRPSSKRNSGEFAISIFRPRTGARRTTSPLRRSIRICSRRKDWRAARRALHAIAGAVRKKSLPENIDAETRSVRSSSSSRALTRTTRQNRSMARFVWLRRRSHSSMEIAVFPRSAVLPGSAGYRAWRARWKACPAGEAAGSPCSSGSAAAARRSEHRTVLACRPRERFSMRNSIAPTRVSASMFSGRLFFRTAPAIAWEPRRAARQSLRRLQIRNRAPQWGSSFSALPYGAENRKWRIRRSSL